MVFVNPSAHCHPGAPVLHVDTTDVVDTTFWVTDLEHYNQLIGFDDDADDTEAVAVHQVRCICTRQVYLVYRIIGVSDVCNVLCLFFHYVGCCAGSRDDEAGSIYTGARGTR